MLPYLMAHRRNVAVAFGAAFLGSLAMALTPAVQKVIIDSAIIGHHPGHLRGLIVVLLALGMFRFVAAYGRRWWGGQVSLDVQYDIRNTIYDQLQRLDFARHDELATGQLVSRASSDVTLIQSMLAILPVMSGNLLMLLVSLVVMAFYSIPLTLMALLVIPLVFFAALRMRTGVFPSAWDAQQQAGEVAGVVDEAVSGVRVVKGFGQEQRELERLTDAAQRLYGSRVRAVNIQARFQAGLQALPALGQVGILALGGWLAIHGQITIGVFFAFAQYLAQLIAPVRFLAIMLTLGQQARAGAERILELLDSNPTVTEKPDAITLVPVTGEVTFDDVRFGYLRSEPVLDGFSLTVAPGETVALVGTSGSGKSTVALLLPRFYDVQSGAVRVDGVDVRDVTLDSLRHQIGVVFEESFLFSDTIRSNIAYGRPGATAADVEAAARAAEAHTFITAMPDGYDTVVGERGLTLSGGQRQRIALARALLTDPGVLILDDATSSIDSRTEEEIHATLRRLMKGRTTLLVAHRRSTLRLADRIVVVDGGRVLDQGTHEELLSRCRLYRSLLSGESDEVEEDSEAAGITSSAWATAEDGTDVTDGARPSFQVQGPMRVGGPGMSRGGMGGGGFFEGLAPTPELMAALAKLPPADDHPRVDVTLESQPDPEFGLRRFLRPYRWPLAVGLGLVVIDSLLMLAGPALTKRGIDAGVTRRSEGALFVAAIAFGLVTVADWWDMWVEARYTGRTGERLLFALRVRIFAHLQRLAIDFYDREMAGRIMTRMTSDVEALSQLLQDGLINAVSNIVICAGVAVLLFVYNARLALVTMLIVPPLLVATIVFRRMSTRAYDTARERIAAVNANLQESLSGVRVAQAFVRERENSSQFREVAGQHLDARLEAQRLQSIYFPFVELLSVAASALVLYAGSGLVRSNALTAGELVAFLLYLTQFFAPIQQLSQVFDAYQQARAAVVKIGELLATPSTTPEAEHPVEPGRLSGRIEFEDVRFRYPNTVAEALAGVDLIVEPGETVALVGETGAGKSTIVKLIPRFYDVTAGHVRLDGIDVRDLALSSLRRQLGYVPQDPFLFSGTVRDNIAYGRPAATDAEVEAAARAVGAHEFVAALPGGYHHPVSERGRSLSGGQRQLIALARARLVDPAVLLLDEATANLDLATEDRVNRAMGVVAEGRTTLLIAHRLQTARRADRIVVIDAGRVVEQGSHDELLAAGGRYAAMWTAFAVEAPT
ncbi:MAG: transporter related [Acidimicrobiales bacterium]|jgi:ATP-binding cassette subfamily B protein|nr:transporter related [Acidimicrobiales bacterium]